jgi:bifunctional ADP-heptose synthase (sugar kinase/adenylyltransferase)
LIYLEDKIRQYYAAPHVDVFDVSGAGDTVMAVIAYGFMNNLSLDQMLSLAVTCGSFVVTKSKTYAIKKTDLEAIRNQKTLADGDTFFFPNH